MPWGWVLVLVVLAFIFGMAVQDAMEVLTRRKRDAAFLKAALDTDHELRRQVEEGRFFARAWREKALRTTNATASDTRFPWED